MPPVEGTSSALWISLYSSNEGGLDVHQAWKEASKLDDALYDGKLHTFEQGGKAFSYYFCEINLAELRDENKVLEKLVKPLEKWVLSGEYPQAY